MVEPGGDYFDVGHSKGNSTSSKNDDMEGQTRDTMLDDARFRFFRKLVCFDMVISITFSHFLLFFTFCCVCVMYN